MLKVNNYVRAGSLAEAYELNQKKSSIIAGGMMWLRMQHRVKLTLIDLSGLGLETIEETPEEFKIGSMCTLRTMETDERLNQYYHGIFKECTRHIVGVQFKNGATVGGSVYGRFGFSDIITCLLALDTYVELYEKGIVPLEEFCQMPFDRDILVRIIIKKDGRRAAYASQRQSKTDFPVIACGVSRHKDMWHISVGARPARAALVVLENQVDKAALAEYAVEQLKFEGNLRGSADYRKHLAKVYVRRLMEFLDREAD